VPDGQIGTLHEAGTNTVFARHTGDYVHSDLGAPGRGMAPIRVCVVGVMLAVNLLHNVVVQARQQIAPDDFGVRLPAVSGDLDTTRNPLLHVGNKRLCVGVITLSRVVGHNQLLTGCDGQIGVLVASFCVIC